MAMRGLMLFLAMAGMLVLSVWVGYILLERPVTTGKPQEATLPTPAITPSRQPPSSLPSLPIIRRALAPVKTPPPVTPPTASKPVASTLLSAIEEDKPVVAITDAADNGTANATTIIEIITSGIGDNVTLIEPDPAPELPPRDFSVIIDLVDDQRDSAVPSSPATNTNTSQIPPPPRQPLRLTARPDTVIYQVQLMSLSQQANTTAGMSEAQAAQIADQLSQKYRPVLQWVRVGISPARVGQGKFWRVVTEDLTRNEARQLCSNLRRIGQECVLRQLPPFPAIAPVQSP